MYSIFFLPTASVWPDGPQLCVFNLALIFQNYFDSLKTKGLNCLPYLQAVNRGLQLAPRYFMNVITLKRCKNGQQSHLVK